MQKEFWSDTQKLLAFATTGSFVLIILVLLAVIIFVRGLDPSIITQLIAAVITLVGTLGGQAGAVNTFYFGSSKSSSNKDETVANVVASQAKQLEEKTNGHS